MFGSIHIYRMVHMEKYTAKDLARLSKTDIWMAQEAMRTLEHLAIHSHDLELSLICSNTVDALRTKFEGIYLPTIATVVYQGEPLSSRPVS